MGNSIVTNRSERSQEGIIASKELCIVIKWFGEQYKGLNLIEGVNAFLEKRKPDFLDR